MLSKIRVAPGSKPGIAGRDARDDLGLGDKHRGTGPSREIEGEARGAPAAPVRRGSPQRPARAAGPRRLRQGRCHPHRLRGAEPTGLQGRVVQGADVHRARPRLPLESARRSSGAWRDRHLQSLPLRGRRCRADARARAREGVEAPARSHRRLGADARRRGDDDHQGVPERLERGAAPPTAGADRRSREAVEVPQGRSRRPRPVRRLHRRIRGRDRRDLDRSRPVVRRAGRPELGQGNGCRRAARRCARANRSAAARSPKTESRDSSSQWPSGA